jgi:hypothetical protein
MILEYLLGNITLKRLALFKPRRSLVRPDFEIGV